MTAVAVEAVAGAAAISGTVAAVAAFATRIVFFALAGAAITCAFRQSPRASAFALVANATLVGSCALSMPQAFPTGAFAILLITQAFVAIIVHKAGSGHRNAADVMPFVMLLTCMGACAVFDVHLAQGAAQAGVERWGESAELANAAKVAAAQASRHVIYICAGLAVMTAALFLAKARPTLLSGHAGAFFLASLALLALPLIFGFEAGGAKSWIGVAGVSLQPSEFAKVTLIIAAAGYLAANASRLTQFSIRGIAPIGVVFAVSLATVALQRDLGCALILFLVLAVMMANSTRNGWVYLLALACAGAGLVAVAYVGFDHVKARFDVWLDPLADPLGAGYQYRMAMRCIANGGLVGCGLGHTLALADLPVAQSDFIYAALAEGLGVAGCAVTLACYAGIVRTAACCASTLPRASFERNLVAAAGALVGAEALLITAGVLGLVPLTGITLPLVSQGGSSCVATLAALGLMMGASLCSKAQAADTDNAQLTAPKILSTLMCLLLAACLAATVDANVRFAGGLRTCGTTAHQHSRGSITTIDGVVLACDIFEDGVTSRAYPQGTLACHVVGAASDGLEAREAPERESSLANVLALPEVGENFALTIDARVQREAESQLDGATGAIVAIDPSTGRVLAMASAPTYTPGQAVDESTQSLINRATSALYSPGSTFKLITLASALERGVATPKTAFSAPAELPFGAGAVRNFQSQSWKRLTLTDAVNASANTVFAQLGEQVGAESLLRTAEQMGFNAPLSFDVGTAASSVAGLETPFELAWASAGVAQGDTVLSATPLQMALVMCALANEGTIMQPHLIDSRADSTGKLTERTEPKVLSKALSPGTAQTIVAMLAENTAARAFCPSIVAGKTGTVEHEGRADDAWYVCFAELDGRKVVVSCIVENAGTGSAAALPRAAAVAQAALE